MLRDVRLVALGAFALTAAAAACSTFEPQAAPDDPIADGGPGEAPAPPDRPDGATPVDAGGDSARPVDAGPRCSLDAPFGAPAIVQSLLAATSHTTGARPTATGIYFVSDRHVSPANFDFVDVYFADARGDEFVNPHPVPNVSSPGEDVSPSETDDELELYLASGKVDVRRIRRAVRKTGGMPYPAPAFVAADGGTLVAGNTQESDPFTVGTHLYFSSARDSAPARIYVADRGAGGPFGAPREVVGLPDGVLRFPVVRRDENEMFFVRYVANDPTVYRATRTPGSAAFDGVEALSALRPSGSSNVNVTGLSADGCDLYLAARAGSGPFFVYRARRGR